MRLLFAGSRYRSLAPVVTDDLLKYFDSLGFSFLTGCADGVDASFRRAFLSGGYRVGSFGHKRTQKKSSPPKMRKYIPYWAV